MKINNNFSSIEEITGKYLRNNRSGGPLPSNSSFSPFEQVLKNKAAVAAEELKFSKHAQARLNDRNIHLTQKQVERLEEAVAKAEKKGIRETLVLVDDMAFIINTKNNLVITAMDSSQTDGNVFTNIDGAVIN